MLELYLVHAVTPGTHCAGGSLGAAVRERRIRRPAEGADPDTLVASARAHLGALQQKLMVPLPSGRPEEMVADRRVRFIRRRMDPMPRPARGCWKRERVEVARSMVLRCTRIRRSIPRHPKNLAHALQRPVESGLAARA